MLVGCTIAFAEVPGGAQSARAALGFGIAVGLLACLPVPLIEVQPAEVKKAAVGTATASKAEMIEWAMERYPSAPWLMRKFKGKMRPIDANEHLADAIATVEAGIKTEQFKQLLALLRGTRTIAA